MGDRLLPIFSHSRDVSLFIGSGSLLSSSIHGIPVYFPRQASALPENALNPEFETINDRENKNKVPYPISAARSDANPPRT